MRLAEDQVCAIKSAIKIVDADAEIKLFGSRIDDEKRGGDIDLLIDSSIMGWREVAKLRGLLENNLGEQKIDIILKSKSDPSFIQMIEADAVLL